MRYIFTNSYRQATVELELPPLAAGEVAERLILAVQTLTWSHGWELSDEILINEEYVWRNNQLIALSGVAILV